MTERTRNWSAWWLLRFALGKTFGFMLTALFLLALLYKGGIAEIKGFGVSILEGYARLSRVLASMLNLISFPYIPENTITETDVFIITAATGVLTFSGLMSATAVGSKHFGLSGKILLVLYAVFLFLILLISRIYLYAFIIPEVAIEDVAAYVLVLLIVTFAFRFVMLGATGFVYRDAWRMLILVCANMIGAIIFLSILATSQLIEFVAPLISSGLS